MKNKTAIPPVQYFPLDPYFDHTKEKRWGTEIDNNSLISLLFRSDPDFHLRLKKALVFGSKQNMIQTTKTRKNCSTTSLKPDL